MLFLIHKKNHPDMTYRGGQEPILHLEADLHAAITWAEENSLRWAFTLSNAGSRYFEDRCRLDALPEVNWAAVQATNWILHKEEKQAEFLVEHHFPWHLVERIGVCSFRAQEAVLKITAATSQSIPVTRMSDWYY